MHKNRLWLRLDTIFTEQCTYVSNFGDHLFEKYMRTYSVDDLKQAIANTQVAINATSHDHLVRCTSMTTLKP